MLLAALAVPALASAQTAGQVTFSPDAYLNATECAAANATTIQLSWTALRPSGATAAAATFQVYASTAAVTISGTTVPTCTSATGSAAIGSSISTTSDTATNQSFDASAFATAVGETTCGVQADKSIYVCVQLSDASAVAIGYATGVLTLSTTPPGAPTNVSVTPGNQALNVGWSAPASGQTVATYRVVATAVDLTADPASPHYSPMVNSATASYRLSGLVNDVPYSVVVYAYSASGTESLGSDPVSGTPLPTEDFFSYYRAQGGREQGGCGTGGAAALSLLGAAALLAARRRM